MRNAARLLHLCEDNGGVYIKLGQHLSQLDYMLPTEYITTLQKLLDNTPVTEESVVRKVIWEEFGKFPEDMWFV